MPEGIAPNPYETHETFGNPNIDLMHIAEMSLRHHRQEVTPENLDIESKRVAYDSIAEILGLGLQELRVLVEIAEVDIFDPESVQSILRDMMHFTLSDSQNQQAVINAAVNYELRDDADALDVYSEMGQRLRKAYIVLMGDLGSEDANNMQMIIGTGINTAARVMPGFWQIIKDNIPEDLEFYEIASSKKTLKTLHRITRSWHRDESSNILTADMLDITESGVGIKPEYEDYFKTQYLDERVSCPAGHMVDVINEHGEAEAVAPIKEIAAILLDGWRAQQLVQGYAERQLEDAL